jgi:nitrite reductase/ring-hydroxylating ferredoxin subunit
VSTKLSRRHFIQCVSSCIAVSASSKLVGCQNGATNTRPGVQRTVRLGALSSIPMGEHIFFVERLLMVRDQKGLGAMSLVCTHQGCMVQRQESQQRNHSTDKDILKNIEYRCPCHGSLFDHQGTVLVPPAQHSLPWYEVILETSPPAPDSGNAEGYTDIQTISVILGKTVTPDWRLLLPVSG